MMFCVHRVLFHTSVMFFSKCQNDECAETGQFGVLWLSDIVTVLGLHFYTEDNYNWDSVLTSME